MANATSGNPIKLDTAVANWAALGLPGQGCIRCYKVIWEQPTSAGDTFTISEADGTVLLTGKAEAASGAVGNTQSFTFTKPLLLSYQRGWYLSQISSGALYIYA